MQKSCIVCRSAQNKKKPLYPAASARFLSIARITVARVSGYSPDEKTPFINFLCRFVYVISRNGLWGGEKFFKERLKAAEKMALCSRHGSDCAKVRQP
jgi:hypothetical protein